MQRDAFSRQLFLKAKVHDILIIINRGGWGYGGVNYEKEARSVIKGIESVLSEWKWDYLTIAYKRLKNPNLITRLKAILSAFTFSEESKYLARTIKELTGEIQGVKVLLIGYSLGCIINNNVMKLLGAYPKVYSIQLGTPFYIKQLSNSHVLDIRKSFDMFAKGNTISFTLAASISLILGVFRMIFLIEPNPAKAVKMFGHAYRWQDEKIKQKIRNFLKRYFSKDKIKYSSLHR